MKVVNFCSLWLLDKLTFRNGKEYDGRVLHLKISSFGSPQ